MYGTGYLLFFLFFYSCVQVIATHEPKPRAKTGMCYVETKSLDGETNLKIRQVGARQFVMPIMLACGESRILTAFRGIVFQFEVQHGIVVFTCNDKKGKLFVVWKEKEVLLKAPCFAIFIFRHKSHPRQEDAGCSSSGTTSYQKNHGIKYQEQLLLYGV